MAKGAQTKQRILEQVVPLLNRRGFLSAPLSEIMQATGMQKGGIYNHFKSKEDLILEAFDYAMDLVMEQHARALKGKDSAIDRLIAMLSVFRSGDLDTPLPGGCPLMNCAIESDHAHPVLRERVLEFTDRWRNVLVRIIAKGIARGELRPGIHPDTVAMLIISTIEGAVMLNNLYRDPVHLQRAVDHLVAYVEKDLKA